MTVTDGAKSREAMERALVVFSGFSDSVECGSSSADFCDDFFGGLVSDERFRVLVPVFGPHFDGVDEVEVSTI